MPGEVRISVRVSPGAPRNEVVGCVDGVWRIKVAAPPVEGKANKELVDFLSDKLDVSKSALTISRGFTGRNKVVVIVGLAPAEVTRRLSS